MAPTSDEIVRDIVRAFNLSTQREMEAIVDLIHHQEGLSPSKSLSDKIREARESERAKARRFTANRRRVGRP